MSGEPNLADGVAPLFYAAYVAVVLMLGSYVVLRTASSKTGLRVLRSVVHWIYRRR